MSVNIAKLLRRGVKSQKKTLGLRTDARLLRDTTGARTAGSLASGPAITTTSYPCEALIELATADNLPETLVASAERKIGIFGASLPAGLVPRPEDRVTIVDIDGASKTFRLVAPVSGDGVAAYFEFTARK